MYDKNTFNLIFQLKFTARSLERQSKRAERESKKKKKKVLEYIKKSNTEMARIYASDAIRKHNESINLLKLSSRIDSVKSRVESVATAKMSARLLTNVTVGLEKAMKDMDLLKVQQVMEKFEESVEDFEVLETTMGDSMAKVDTAGTDQVDELISQVADEFNLEIKELLPELVEQREAKKISQPATATSAKRQAVIQ
mmetsp:Transcript_10898/g.11971  ORF Transcript_10898/g.11971 Transcript_10898/m.11971 type:complete len:197 (+) Transcript_10898:35-625(+)